MIGPNTMQTLPRSMLTVKVLENTLLCVGPKTQEADCISTIGFYNKHEIGKFTKLQHRVRKAVWLEDINQWHIEVEHIPSGTLKQDRCDVLVNATGFLNKWRWPEIEGLETFAGPKVHSANWDHSVEFKDKVVGLIGTGSSAIQVSQVSYHSLQYYIIPTDEIIDSATVATGSVNGCTTSNAQQIHSRR